MENLIQQAIKALSSCDGKALFMLAGFLQLYICKSCRDYIIQGLRGISLPI